MANGPPESRWQTRARLRCGLFVTLTFVLVTVGFASTVGAQSGLPTMTSSIDPPTDTHTYPSFDADGNPAGEVEWRVIEETGNCCENFLTATPDGRLIDVGGTWVHVSEDEGKTWTRVEPTAPFVIGEGAAVYAPNGDILVVDWAPAAGDRLIAYKYDAQQEEWFYQENPLHTPFYDRPWISLVPGPLTINGETVPYVAIAKGGWPSQEGFVMSTDGLHYVRPSSKVLERISRPAETGWLSEPTDSMADWYQPHTETGITPLPSGSALVHEDWPGLGCDWSLFSPALEWRCFDTPAGLDDPSGGEDRYLFDSQGWLHRVQPNGTDRLEYVASSDGGETWENETLHLPTNHSVEDWDFKVNADLGVAAVAVHAHNATAEAEEDHTDQDMVFELDVTGEVPALERRYEVGAGDVDAGSGAGGSNRFDFTTVAILDTGRIATTLIDSDHENPSVAVQVE